jgi:hypothetical protein
MNGRVKVCGIHGSHEADRLFDNHSRVKVCRMQGSQEAHGLTNWLDNQCLPRSHHREKLGRPFRLKYRANGALTRCLTNRFESEGLPSEDLIAGDCRAHVTFDVSDDEIRSRLMADVGCGFGVVHRISQISH